MCADVHLCASYASVCLSSGFLLKYVNFLVTIITCVHVAFVSVCVAGRGLQGLIHHIKKSRWGMGLKLDSKSYYAKAWL